jgi:hypothetical protein
VVSDCGEAGLEADPEALTEAFKAAAGATAEAA